MRFPLAAPLFVALALIAGCSQQEEVPMPDPFTLDAEAIGRYCGMNVLEHDGPKGQIILTRIPEAIWFSSARDAVAFTMLPDEPKNIAAIYVSDMAVAESWEQPGADNWIDAKTAFFVLGSRQRGGMGTAETVPFSTEDAARAFAAANGGEVMRFDDIPLDYVLGGPDADEDEDTEPVGAIPPHGNH
ncbi:MAG: nitrous oxide reductase accessory protein NosL [Aquamicrobium sp.]|uniref:nitrous oxide reductase accessory protein NosL n=1 Tax=Aquamicrobium sp. TaxID=1872579 RepID=UPI00349EF36D|nr:nitrous oxide reductase accessory protein NosL [Aquamicrobium sp.]